MGGATRRIGHRSLFTKGLSPRGRGNPYRQRDLNGDPRSIPTWAGQPLAVDDDPQTLRFVRDALSNAGYTVTVTGDPEQVGRLVEEDRPHLVLLDLMLPGVDGIELMESVPELADLPVIFLSAYGRDQVIARALEAGAEDYMVKPFSPTELVARVQTALRRRAAAELSEPPEPYRRGELTIDYAERPGLPGGPRRPADQHRVPAALRAFGQRRAGADSRATAPAGVGAGTLRAAGGGAHLCQEPSPQAGRTTPTHPPTSSPSPVSATGCRRGRRGSGRRQVRDTQCSSALQKSFSLPLIEQSSLLFWCR